MKETFSKILPFVPIISLIGILLAFVINTISKEPFKLRHDSITLEYGAPLSEDLSEYVIAENYDKVTCNYNQISLSAFFNKETGSAVFLNENKKGETLTLEIHYQDTTPPAIADRECTFYMLSGYDIAGQPVISVLDAPYVGYSSDKGPTLWDTNVLTKVYLNVYDNSFYYILDSLTIDGVSIDLSESYSMEPYVYASWEPLSVGDHSVSLTLSDKFGNTASYDALIHVVYDLSPENRAELSAHYTEAEIRAAIEQAKPMD